jgi:8-oxo-dGTP pyrophosphatase MutT (NUDIX family)
LRRDVYFPASPAVGLKLRNGRGKLEAKIRKDLAAMGGDGGGYADRWKKTMHDPCGCVSASEGVLSSRQCADLLKLRPEQVFAVPGKESEPPLPGNVVVYCRKNRTLTSYGESTVCEFTVLALLGDGRQQTLLVEHYQSHSAELQDVKELARVVASLEIPLQEATVCGYPSIVFEMAKRAMQLQSPPSSRRHHHPCVAFSLVVVENSDCGTDGGVSAPESRRFVLVHEKKKRGWWLPGGGVDAGQLPAEAAVREAKEEAGIDIVLTGLLRVEHTFVVGRKPYSRLRFIYLARPAEVTGVVGLKTVPDSESKGARWMTLDETTQLQRGKLDVSDCHLRGEEPVQWFAHRAARGGPACPLEMLRSTRVGASDDASSGQSGERAFYPTAFRVLLAVGKIAEDGAPPSSEPRFLAAKKKKANSTGDDSWELPSMLAELEENPSLEASARVFAKTLGLDLCEFLGVVEFRHQLNLVQQASGTALLEVVYAVRADAASAPPEGFTFLKLGAFADGDGRALTKMLSGAVAPLGILAAENTPLVNLGAPIVIS